MDAATSRRPRTAPRHTLAALRATQWLHFALLPAACFDLDLAARVGAPALLRGVSIAACVLGFGYLLNAVSDRRLDRDARKNPLIDGELRPVHRAALGLLPALALSLSLLGPPLVLVATATALTCGTVYSVGPRLKARPVVCTLLNVGCFAPLMLVGAAGSSIDPARLALLACFALLLLQNQLLHEAADAPEDRRGRLRTTFVALGRERSALVMLLLGLAMAAATVWLLIVRDVSWLLAAHALPYILVFPTSLARHGERPARMARARRQHRLFSVASGALLFTTVMLS